MADPISVEQNLENDIVPNMPAKNRSFYMAFFQMRRPVLSGELNHIQQIQRDALGRTAATFAQQGWAFRSDFSTNWEAIANSGGSLNAETTSLIMTLGRTSALVSDTPIEVGSANGNGDLVIDLGTAPTTGTRYDGIFLEVWNESIGGFGTSASDQDIYTFGREGGATEYNDILQTDIVNTESARRIQTRWRIRVVSDIPLSDTDVFSSQNVNAQGANTSPVAGHSFINLGITPTEDGPARRELNGLYRAGAYSQSQANDLGTTDGYVWALPMFISTRTAGVSEPDIADIRQLTNGNLIGVFEFLAPCTLIVKALPIRYFDCSKTFEQARLSSTALNPSMLSDQMQGLFASRQYQSTVPGPSGAVGDLGTPPLIVASSTMVVNLNSEYVQGAKPGTSAGNILALDNNANAVVGGKALSLAGLTGVNGPDNTVNFINAMGDLWITENASYDKEGLGLDLFETQNANFASTAMHIERATGKISFNYIDAGFSVLNFNTTNTVFSMDKRGGQSTLNTNFALPTGKLAIGKVAANTQLDILGVAVIDASAINNPALTIVANPSSDGFVVTGQSFGTKAVNASSLAGDAIYGTSGLGNGGHFVSTNSNGYSLFVEGGRSAFMPLTTNGTIFVGFNNNNPIHEIDVKGQIKTDNLQIVTPSAPPNPGDFFSAIDNSGLGHWTAPPTNPVPQASGNAGFYARWNPVSGVQNSLDYGTLFEANNNQVFVGGFTYTAGFPSNSTSADWADFNIATSLMLGAIVNTKVPNTITDFLSLTNSGGLIFGSQNEISVGGAAAIFSNEAYDTLGTGPTQESNIGGLSFMTQNTVNMVIAANGNVGIGIVDVGIGTRAKLEVRGNAGFGTGVAGNARISTNQDFVTISTNPSNSNLRAGVQFQHNATRLYSIVTDSRLEGINTFSINKHTSNDDGAAILFIDTNNRVGINNGVTPPNYQLDVNGDIGTSGNVYVKNPSATVGASASLYIRRDNAADKNAAIIFQSYNSVTPSSPITNYSMSTVDASANGGGTAFKIKDSVVTRVLMDDSTKTITINPSQDVHGIDVIGKSALGIGSYSGSTASTIFSANGGLLPIAPTNSGNVLTLATFGIQTLDGVTTHNMSINNRVWRLSQGGTMDTVAIGIALDSDSTINTNPGIWFYNNASMSIGALPSVNNGVTNTLTIAYPKTTVNGSLNATGFITTNSNMGMGSGYNAATMNDITNTYLRISKATPATSTSNSQVGIEFLNGSVSKYLIGTDFHKNNQQNFFINDTTAGTGGLRLFIDGVGNVGLRNNGTNPLRADFDVAGTAIINRMGIGVTGVSPDDATSVAGGQGVLSVRGPSTFLGNAIQMNVGKDASYGVFITAPSFVGGQPNPVTALWVNTPYAAGLTYGAQISSSNHGLGITALSTGWALFIASGNTHMEGWLDVAGLNNSNETYYGIHATDNIIAGSGTDRLSPGGGGIGGGIVSYGYDHISEVAPYQLGLNVVHNAYFGANSSVAGQAVFGGNVGIYGVTSMINNLYLYNDASASIANSLRVGNLTSLNHLDVSSAAVLHNSVQLVPNGGRLLALLGEYAGHNIKDYLYIDQNNAHLLYLVPKRFTGLTIGIGWYEILGTIAAPTTLGMSVGSAYGTPLELVASPAAPIDIFTGFGTTSINLEWHPMGTIAANTAGVDGYYGPNSEANKRVIATYWHTEADGLIPFSMDTSELEFSESPSVGLRIREFDTNGNNNGTAWSGNVDAWLDNDIGGNSFPSYRFYTTKPGFVQFIWNVEAALSTGSGTAVDCYWSTHIISALPGANLPTWSTVPAPDSTEIAPIRQRWVNGTSGGYSTRNSSWMQYVPPGTHEIRQSLHLAGGYGTFEAAESFLQLVFWGAEPNGYATSSSPIPAVPAVPVQPSAPPVTKPGVPLNVTAGGTWTRAEECHWSQPSDTGNGAITYDIQFTDYGSVANGANNPFNPPQTVLVHMGTATGYQRDCVEDDHTVFQVRAVNSHGNGDWSSPVDAYTWHTNIPDPPSQQNGGNGGGAVNDR